MDVPQRAVAALVGRPAQDVQRVEPVDDGRVQALAVRVAGAGLAVDERREARPRDVGAVLAGRGGGVQRGRVRRVLERRRALVRRVGRDVADGPAALEAVRLAVDHAEAGGVEADDLVRLPRGVRDLRRVEHRSVAQFDQRAVAGLAARARHRDERRKAGGGVADDLAHGGEVDRRGDDGAAGDEVVERRVDVLHGVRPGVGELRRAVDPEAVGRGPARGVEQDQPDIAATA